MRQFIDPTPVGRGKNVSGIYIAQGGYVLVYAQKDYIILETKCYPQGAGDITSSPVSYSQALSRSGGLRVEYAGGRLTG